MICEIEAQEPEREPPIEEPEPGPAPMEEPEHPRDPGPAEDPEKHPVHGAYGRLIVTTPWLGSTAD